MTTAHAEHSNHPPHLAHHFDTPQQQFESGKLGMWVFLATEILMFGGLFCAYAVYRANNPDVFLYAHHYLDTFWGATNTVVLLVSSFTMAWGVRAAQLGQRKLLVLLLGLTLLGGAGFMVIKAIEYKAKFATDLTPGRFNVFFPPAEDRAHRLEQVDYLERRYVRRGEAAPVYVAPGRGDEAPQTAAPTAPDAGEAVAQAVAATDGEVAVAATAPLTPPAPRLPIEVSLIAPAAAGPAGLSAPIRDAQPIVVDHGVYSFDALSPRDQHRVGIFFSIYWMMTGLHGIHVLVGLGIISWLMYRAGSMKDRAWILPLPLLLAGGYLLFLWLLSADNFPVAGTIFAIVGGLALLAGIAWTAIRVVQYKTAADTGGDFGPEYFTPVDLGGLYWHLVDLIWIFLFPLLYLIH
jgi:cytochrome c oxidase subunit 3